MRDYNCVLFADMRNVIGSANSLGGQSSQTAWHLVTRFVFIIRDFRGYSRGCCVCRWLVFSIGGFVFLRGFSNFISGVSGDCCDMRSVVVL